MRLFGGVKNRRNTIKLIHHEEHEGHEEKI